jgi:hypothetical protein
LALALHVALAGWARVAPEKSRPTALKLHALDIDLREQVPAAAVTAAPPAERMPETKPFPEQPTPPEPVAPSLSDVPEEAPPPGDTQKLEDPSALLDEFEREVAEAENQEARDPKKVALRFAPARYDDVGASAASANFDMLDAIELASRGKRAELAASGRVGKRLGPKIVQRPGRELFEGAGDFGDDENGPFRVLICKIPKGTAGLAVLDACEPEIGSHTSRIDVPTREWTTGFPGFPALTTWFAVNYEGAFTVKKTGRYEFRLLSDDGSILQIDGGLVIEHDGIHGPTSKSSTITLRAGKHHFTLWYYQGIPSLLALQLFVRPPGGEEQLFSSEI